MILWHTKKTLNIITRSYIYVVYNQAMKTGNYDTFYYQLSITYHRERMKILYFVPSQQVQYFHKIHAKYMIIVAWERMLLISSLH